MYNLRDNPTIIFKVANKSLIVVDWDRKDYLKWANKPFEDGEVYIEVPNDPGVLLCVIMEALEKVHLHGDLSSDTVKHVLVEDPKFVNLYILPKIFRECTW